MSAVAWEWNRFGVFEEQKKGLGDFYMLILYPLTLLLSSNGFC